MKPQPLWLCWIIYWSGRSTLRFFTSKRANKQTLALKWFSVINTKKKAFTPEVMMLLTCCGAWVLRRCDGRQRGNPYYRAVVIGDNGYDGGRSISGGASAACHAVVVGTLQRLQGIEGRTVRFELGVPRWDYRLWPTLGAISNQDRSCATNDGNAVIVYTGRAKIIVAVGFRFAQAVIVIIVVELWGLLLLLRLQVRREASGRGCDFLYVCWKLWGRWT